MKLERSGNEQGAAKTEPGVPEDLTPVGFEGSHLHSYRAVFGEQHFERYTAKEQEHADHPQERNEGTVVPAESLRTRDSDDGDADEEQERYAIETEDDKRSRTAGRKIAAG